MANKHKSSSYLRREIKVLLLGCGESGKTTFLKQMKIIHGQEFSNEDILEFRTIIYGNIIRGLKVLTDARDKLGIQWGDTENEKHAAKIMSCDNSVTLDPGVFVDYVPSCKALWKDIGIQDAYDRRREFQLPAEPVKYFLDDIDRVGQREYLPIRQDILYAYRATKGIIEYVIDTSRRSQSVPVRFVDTGGQRSQRQKWFHCFSNVTVIFMVVSCSAFDECLMEDRTTNRIVESSNVFDTLYNHKYFRRVPVILFLNKSDLLEKNIKKGVDIKQWFPGFKGDHTKLEDVQQFILAMYDARRRYRNKAFFHQFTTAVDTDNIKQVFYAVYDIILEENLKITFGQRGGRADED